MHAAQWHPGRTGRYGSEGRRGNQYYTHSNGFVQNTKTPQRSNWAMLLPILIILAGVVAVSHITPFPMLLDAASGDLTLWRKPVAPGDKVIYLTFDDGPNPTATPQLLDLLNEKNVRATFFLIDDYVNESTARIVRRMAEEGHSIGQHTGQRWLLLKTPDGLAHKLTNAADKLERLSGHRPCKLFRPHAGWRSVSMFMGAKRAGYQIVGWSWMSWDFVWGKKRTGPRVAEHVLAHAAPGKIVVIHDGHHKNPRANREYAIEAAGLIIDQLRAEGYRFGTLCDLPESSK
jgi:peptidoglycan/xylan/chitin deacetylase (PgdA/CDA1 family)